MKQLKSEQGAAILELALVLPVLFVLFFASLELVRALEAKNAIAIFSREAAHSVFTTCVELDTRDYLGRDPHYVQDCVDAEGGKLFDIATGATNPIMPGMTMVISVYEAKGTTVTRLAQSFFPAGTPTKYPGTSGNGPGTNPGFFSALAGARGTKVVIAETNFGFRPVVYAPLSLALYEVTIY